MKIDITFVWNIRLQLYAEGNKLYAEGSKLWAEGSKLRAEGDKLRAEGDKLWAEAVIEAYGNATIKWKSGTHCFVNGKDEYQ